MQRAKCTEQNEKRENEGSCAEQHRRSVCRARHSALVKLLPAVLTALFLLLSAPFPAAAETAVVDGAEAVTLPPEYADLESCIPPELADILPDGLFSENTEEALAAAERLTDWQYLLNALLSALGLRLSDAVRLLCSLIGLILIAAVMGKLREGIGGGSGETFGFCLRLALYTAIVLQTAGMVEVVQTFFAQLSALMGGMIPVMGIFYALGGNLGQAALNGEIMLAVLAICEYVSATVTPPVCAICMSFSLMDAFGVRLTLAPLCEQVKRWYASILGLIMFILSLSLSVQSVLTSRADTLAMRGVKYAVGNMIPMVGGAVSGTLGTVAAGVSLLRGVCGVSGIILIALLLLPALVQLLLLRATLRLAATTAALLSCDGEARLLSEMASLHGYLAAAVSICGVTFVLGLTLMVKSTVAIG